jgi:phage gp45-like
MNRNSLIETAGRAMHVAVRFTLNKAVDDPMMQIMNFDGMNSEGRNAVERVQGYGMTSMPLPRDEQEGGQQQEGGGNGGGGVGGDGEKAKGPAAEGIALFLGGQRNHPVVIAVDDRRHRPMGLKPGENAQYDDQGQMTLLRRNGLYLLSLDTEEKGKDGKSQKTERMVSLRHVEKKKQERPKIGQSGGAAARALDSAVLTAGSGQQQQKKKEDFKHEGETVNTEVRCTKNRIEFRAGEKVVGYYDVKEDTWYFTAKLIHSKATSELKDEAPKINHN